MLTDVIVFTEYNDNEGETWNFYTPYDEDVWNILTDLVVFDESYALTRSELHLDTVRELPCAGGYMPEHNVLRPLNLDKLIALAANAEAVGDEEAAYNIISDAFYKGGIENFQVEEE